MYSLSLYIYMRWDRYHTATAQTLHYSTKQKTTAALPGLNCPSFDPSLLVSWLKVFETGEGQSLDFQAVRMSAKKVLVCVWEFICSKVPRKSLLLFVKGTQAVGRIPAKSSNNHFPSGNLLIAKTVIKSSPHLRIFLQFIEEQMIPLIYLIQVTFVRRPELGFFIYFQISGARIFGFSWRSQS